MAKPGRDNRGRWLPGWPSLNPQVSLTRRPVRDAAMLEATALANGEIRKHPKGSLRAASQALLIKASQGDVAAYNAIADRLEGKAPTTIVGDADQPVSFLIERAEEARASVLAKLQAMAARGLAHAAAIEGEVVERGRTRIKG